MITLSEIKDLARDEVPGAERSLALLLLAWARKDPGGELAGLLRGTGIGREALVEWLEKQRDLWSSTEDGQLLSSCILGVRSGPVLGIHLLETLCEHAASRISRSLRERGMSLERLQANIAQGLERSRRAPLVPVTSQARTAGAWVECVRDLTALAQGGAFDALCDRPEEIDRVLDILLRANKGNVILTGPAGVGKTALIELLARRVATGDVLEGLRATRIYELNVSKVVAGTRYRGDFEERMHSIIREVQARTPAILFIDEVHLLWGAGSAENVTTDAANILKPFLARGAVRVIGATTAAEYHRYIARDAALVRRFQVLQMREPGEDLTGEMVQAQARALQEHHGVIFAEGTVRQAIRLTQRYLPNLAQPDKTVDLLDSACVNVVRQGRREVRLSDLAGTLVRQTGHRISVLDEDDREGLLRLADELRKRVVGQDAAIQRVAETLAYRRQGLGGDRQMLGSFLFAGELGVGKTELARAVAGAFFGRENALIEIDLADCGQAGSVNRLVGAPMGYMDSDREGVLSAWLRVEGSGVILFREVEKAHPEVQALLVGLLDRGGITTPRGEHLDCRQCVVILTTRAVRSSGQGKGSLGFVPGAVRADPAELLVDPFPRELLPRLDEVILFHPLGEEEIERIAHLRLEERLDRIRKGNVRWVYDDKRLLNHLLGFLGRSRSGAKEIARIIEKKLLQPISLALLRQPGDADVEVALEDPFYERGTVTVKVLERGPVS